MAGHGNAGLASNFIDIAHAKVRPGGVLALVLPASFLQGAAWDAARDRFRGTLFGCCGHQHCYGRIDRPGILRRYRHGRIADCRHTQELTIQPVLPAVFVNLELPPGNYPGSGHGRQGCPKTPGRFFLRAGAYRRLVRMQAAAFSARCPTPVARG